MKTKHLPNWQTANISSLGQFSKIRLVALDLDGTMIQSGESDLFERIQKMGNTLKSRCNVSLTISTGRTLTGVKILLDKLHLPKDFPLILYNGSVVVENVSYHSLYKKTISAQTLEQILIAVSPYRVRTLAYIYDRSASKLFGMPAPYEYVLGWSKLEPIKYEFNGMQIFWKKNIAALEEIAPSAVLIDTSVYPESGPDLETILKQIENISVTRSGTSYIEIRPEKSDKGAALSYVAKHLNLTSEEVLALGDNDNDVEMLAWAGIGVAVAKASASAIRNANYICQYGVAEGVVELLRLIKTAKRYS